MYGGLISVPRIALCNGNINLYGGTLEYTYPDALAATDPNFIFYQGFPENRIDISGGTLKLKGNYSATSTYDPNLAGLIASRRIISGRGTLGTPVFDGTYTTLTSTDNNMAQAWNPSPYSGADRTFITQCRRWQCRRYTQLELGRHQCHKHCCVFRNKRQYR